MNILYHHRTQGHGAEGVHIMGIVQGLERAGHRVQLLSPPGVDPTRSAGGYLYGKRKGFIGRLWKWASSAAPQVLFELMELGYNLFHAFRLRRILSAEKFDLVFERYAFFLFATAWLARRAGIPFILEVNEIAGIRRARPLVLARLAEAVERWLYAQATGVVTVSSFLRDQIIARGGDPQRILVLPNAADIALFDPRRNDGEVRRRLGFDGKTVIGFVGWIDPWDNLPGLLEVFHGLLREHPDLRLLLVGDIVGKGVSREPVERLMDSLDLRDKVRMVAQVPRTEMPAHIGAMDICLIPDSNPFGSPVVLFEFMAMGKPVAGPSVAPIRDVIRDGENGVIFEAHNAGDMARALRSLIGDPVLRQRLGAAARRSVEERHTWDANTRAILELADRARVATGGIRARA